MADRMATIDDLKIDSPSPRRTKRKRRWPVLGAVILLALLVGAGWHLRGYFGLKATTVEVHTVAADNPASGPSFTAGGYLEVIPPGPFAVSALVEGRVQSVKVIEGEMVQEGQVLACLDDVLYRQEIKVRESGLALARAGLPPMRPRWALASVWRS